MGGVSAAIASLGVFSGGEETAGSEARGAAVLSSKLIVPQRLLAWDGARPRFRKRSLPFWWSAKASALPVWRFANVAHAATVLDVVWRKYLKAACTKKDMLIIAICTYTGTQKCTNNQQRSTEQQTSGFLCWSSESPGTLKISFLKQDTIEPPQKEPNQPILSESEEKQALIHLHLTIC
jgi:hypothetical protein